MGSIFAKIVNGEIPCAKVWEDSRHLAFLDIQPIRPGHTLVIPKREVEYLFDLDESEYLLLHQAVHKVAIRMKEVLQCSRVCVTVAGFEVPHVHVHLIPTDSMEDFPFPPRMSIEKDALREMAQRLRF